MFAIPKCQKPVNFPCVCMSIHVFNSCVHIHVEVRGQFSVSFLRLRCHPHFYWDEASHGLKAWVGKADWLAIQQAPGMPLNLPPRHWGYKSVPHLVFFKLVFRVILKYVCACPEGVRSPAARMQAAVSQHCGCWELNSGPLREHESC